MKKILLHLIIVLTALNSCTTIKSTYPEYPSPQLSNVGNGIFTGADSISEKNFEKSHDSENWNVDQLNTAVNAEYLNSIEKDVILEINKVRTNPAKYANFYIVPMLSKFIGKEYRLSPNYYLITNEGKSAVQECVKVLKSTKPLSILYPNRDLYNLALDHVKKQGPAGETGHFGPTGESFLKRIKRVVGNPNYSIAENIAYGENNARGFVIQLLIDDGVPSRGHRKNILNKKFNSIGAAVGSHKKFKKMCVIDFGEI